MTPFAAGPHAASEAGSVSLKADVVIVGSGPGGSAAAAALSAAGRKVIVLEEGRHWAPQQFRPSALFAYRNLYQERAMRTLRGNVPMLVPGGRGVGGSTLINSAICFRTPPEVLRRWREDRGCHRFTDARFDPYFERIWRTLAVTVNPIPIQRNNNLVFKRGADALGLAGAFLARSAPACVGCGSCQFGCTTGGKWTADRTFLAEALATQRCGVYADCKVETVEVSGDRVTAVTGKVLDPETQKPVGTLRAEADVFVLAAGTIGTPLLLLANGLADDTVCGRNLVVHPALGALARMEEEIHMWSGVSQGYYVDCWRDGYLLQTFTASPDSLFPLVQAPVGPKSMEIMADLRYVATAGALVHDEDSSGSVSIGPLGPDLVYELGDGDRKRMLAGMRKTCEVFFAAGARTVWPGIAGVDAVGRDDDVMQAIPDDIVAGRLMPYASHPMGTCRMGTDPRSAVVDPDGRVFGWSNLRVADASVFPTSLGVNPQVTTYAIGLMVGEAIAS